MGIMVYHPVSLGILLKSHVSMLSLSAYHDYIFCTFCTFFKCDSSYFLCFTEEAAFLWFHLIYSYIYNCKYSYLPFIQGTAQVKLIWEFCKKTGYLRFSVSRHPEFKHKNLGPRGPIFLSVKVLSSLGFSEVFPILEISVIFILMLISFLQIPEG